MYIPAAVLRGLVKSVIFVQDIMYPSAQETKYATTIVAVPQIVLALQTLV